MGRFSHTIFPIPCILIEDKVFMRASGSTLSLSPLSPQASEAEISHRRCFCSEDSRDPSLQRIWFQIDSTSRPQRKLEPNQNKLSIAPDCESSTKSNSYPLPINIKKRKREISNYCSKKAKTQMDRTTWPIDLVNHYTQVMVAVKVKAGMWVGGKFSQPAWEMITTMFHDATRKNYTEMQLKSKYNRLMKEWRQMRWLIENPSQTGAGWDPVNQTIQLTDASKWSWINEFRPNAVKFLNKGLPNFDILNEIFHDSSAQGTFARSSMQRPLTDEEENELEAMHNNIGSQSFPNSIDLDNVDEAKKVDVGKRSCTSNTSSGSKRKSAYMQEDFVKGKSVKGCKIDVATQQVSMMQQWEEESRSRQKKLDLQLQLMQNMAIQEEQYGIPACMQLLRNIPEVPIPIYDAVAAAFSDANFRKTWVTTSADHRKWLVENKFKQF